jgi:uncharacterized membrane protein YedE/YeeE
LLLFEDVFVALLLGGSLIGLAVGVLTLLTGRVMSGSGMIGSLLGGAEGVAATSIAFIGGIVFAPLVMTGLGLATQPVVEADWPFLVAGGLLVGFAARFGGASLGGAMTGMARRSRNAAAIFVTMFVGAAISVYLQLFLSDGGVV